MRTHFTWSAALASAAFVLLLAGAAAADKSAAKAKPAFKPSRADLAASYKPLMISGTPWYTRVGAARWHGQKKQRKDGKERLILQLRVLGPLDGAT